MIPHSFLLRTRYAPEKYSRENQNTHFMFKIFFPEYCAIDEIMWKNTGEPERSQMVI
jgi:hypothetical protein